jgi:hypothetical protein
LIDQTGQMCLGFVNVERLHCHALE